jgi:hypothetical protein
MKNVFLVLLVGLAVTLTSWGTLGHRLVGLVAQSHLDADAKSYVAKLLSSQTLADVSNYADQESSHPSYPNLADYHRLSLPAGLSRQAFNDTVIKQPGNNIYTSILLYKRMLLSETSSDAELAEAIKWLTHLVADAHQPMHIAHAKDDYGKQVKLRLNGKRTNLQQLWDSTLLAAQPINEAAFVQTYSGHIPVPLRVFDQTDEEVLDWLWESYQISSRLYAESITQRQLNEDYYNIHIPTVRSRIVAAGIRLAAMLNSCLLQTGYGKQNEFYRTHFRRLGPPNTYPAHLEVPVKKAADFVGTTVYVVGKVYSYRDADSATVLYLGAKYPKQLLNVVLHGKARLCAARLNRKTICVKGDIIDDAGKLNLSVSDTTQIEIGHGYYHGKVGLR